MKHKKNCAICGNEFKSLYILKKFCSEDCKTKNAKIKAKQYYENSFNLKKRWFILERDNFTCQYCGRTVSDGIKLQIDHRTPKTKKGTDRVDNLITSCNECNKGKNDRIIPKKDGEEENGNE